MLKVPTRADLDALAGRTPKPAPVPEPAPAPDPAPALSPHVEQALVALSKHVQDVATLAAKASADVAAALARPAECYMEAEFLRDPQGRLTRAIIRKTKDPLQEPR